MSRLPAVLAAASCAVLGWALGPLIGKAEYWPGGAVVGGMGLLFALILDTRPVRERMGWLPPRSRLSKLYTEVADLRGQLRAAYIDRTTKPLVKTDWDWRISELETRLWKEINAVLPDDFRALQRENVQFATVNADPYASDDRWAHAMLGLLQKRLDMIRKEMERQRITPRSPSV